MLEILIIIFFFGVVVWVAFKLSRSAASSADSVLADAWRVVLSDPNYERRRPLEERKHLAENKAQALARAAKESSEATG